MASGVKENFMGENTLLAKLITAGVKNNFIKRLCAVSYYLLKQCKIVLYIKYSAVGYFKT
jgi:hypothetical protein